MVWSMAGAQGEQTSNLICIWRNKLSCHDVQNSTLALLGQAGMKCLMHKKDPGTVGNLSLCAYVRTLNAESGFSQSLYLCVCLYVCVCVWGGEEGNVEMCMCAWVSVCRRGTAHSCERILNIQGN